MRMIGSSGSSMNFADPVIGGAFGRKGQRVERCGTMLAQLLFCHGFRGIGSSQVNVWRSLPETWSCLTHTADGIRWLDKDRARPPNRFFFGEPYNTAPYSIRRILVETSAILIVPRSRFICSH